MLNKLASKWIFTVCLTTAFGCSGSDPSPDGGPDAGQLDGEFPSDAGQPDGGGAQGDATVLDGPSDAGPNETRRLILGQADTGRVTLTEFITYRIALEAGDVIRLSAFTLQGTLQPSAYVSLGSTFIEPSNVDIGNQQVILDYTIDSTGDYTIVAQPYQDMGEGEYLLNSECTGGSCSAAQVAPPDVPLRLLGINDFHGHVEPPSNTSGGAAWLAAHLDSLRAPAEHTLVLSAGDLIGASPFLSARYHDEPTIEAMNLMGLDIAAVGNHEFDEGPEELLRLVQGGCHPEDGCEDGTPIEGARFDVLAANVEVSAGMTLLPSTVVRVFGGLPVGIIGMTLEGTRAVTVPSQVEDLEFLDEVATVNREVPRLQAMGAETIVVVVHEGGSQDGSANDCDGFRGRIQTIATMVDQSVDVILSGHTHRTYNCVVEGKVVTSAGSQGRWISVIDMVLSGRSREPMMLDALNHRVDHDLSPNPQVAALVARYRTLVDAEEQRVIGTLAEDLWRSTDNAGQSTLGFVIADSHLAATQAAGAQIAFMNRGGIRADLRAGDITFGDACAVQPFENDLITFTLTGQQLKDLLDGQFAFGGFSVLQPSATLRYQIELINAGTAVAITPGSITVAGLPLDVNASYRITANSFLAEGGEGLGIFAQGTDRVNGGRDVDAFVDYLANSPSPLPTPALDRITF